MPVPDQSHINRVRDALWQRFGGGASVMVGSGFSTHALKIRPDAEGLPLWRDVVEKMSGKLYPQGSGGASATDGHLRTAQEYETAFGRSDLHHFIRQTVRNDDFEPGEAHVRLLRLPWRDVFTTNWDTLLERARISVPERAYSVVTNRDEIPLASRPRIIKLHGSLPAQFPLICTEEDYRTYPTKFAPFVNTVQQAMMETVLCLIGFSGDDPNFLEWSGWVRDNLGDTAPKIYLAGWLNLSPHRRRMLEDRNVVPVDLARHPKSGTWPEHLRHRYATDWLLHTLERGRPRDVTKWPSRSDRRWKPVPQDIQPVEEPASDEQPADRPPPLTEHDSGQLIASVRETLKVWAHNRKLYPGWLAVPANSRFSMQRHTDPWEGPILDALPEFSPVERLNALHELTWRREIMLEPISPQLETSAEEVLREINCQARTIDGAATETDWNAVREAWRAVALALVTAARYRFEQEVFDKRIEALSPFHHDHPDIAQRIRHERCLWAAYSLDYQNLESLLKDWRTEGCDPVWMLRKAALLVEVNRVEEAVQLLNRTLLAIRENPGDGRSLAGPSREGWALCLVARLENVWHSGQGQVETPESFREWGERRVELAPLKCDAFEEMRRYREDITGETERTGELPFDLGMRQESFTFSDAQYSRQIAAHRAIRLYEVAGLATTGSDILKRAAQTLSVQHPELAARLILRISNYDRDRALTHVFSRACVAALLPCSAATLADICIGVIEYARPRMGRPGPGVYWIERMRVSVEVLSRLVLRLASDKAETIFDKSLEVYRNQQIAEESWMATPVRNLLSRSWEALPEARRTARILDLLSAPIVGLDLHIYSDFKHWYPDPGELLDESCSPPARTADNESRWQEIVGMWVRGLDAGGEARKRATLRVASIVLWKQNLLTEAERSRIAEALWRDDHTDAGRRLPSQTALYDWVFLLMPQPQPGIAERRFRAKWLAPNRDAQKNSSKSDNMILYHVGIAMSGLKSHQHPLKLSKDEQSYLTEVVDRWSDTPLPTHSDPYAESGIRILTHLALSGLPYVLAEIRIPESIGEKLCEKVQELNNAGIPGFGLIAGLVRAMPNRFADLSMLMRTGLASDSEDLARGAVEGLYRWLTTSVGSPPQIQPPPVDLVREIGIIIAARRKASLKPSLQMAKWVFDEGSSEQQGAIRDSALHGLGYLAEELQYGRDDHDPDDDVPLLRWCSAQLASSMAARGFENAPAVVRWLEIAENDPLPEVRYVKRPAITRESC